MLVQFSSHGELLRSYKFETGTSILPLDSFIDQSQVLLWGLFSEIPGPRVKDQRCSFLVLDEGKAKAWGEVSFTVVLLWGTLRNVEKTDPCSRNLICAQCCTFSLLWILGRHHCEENKETLGIINIIYPDIYPNFISFSPQIYTVSCLNCILHMLIICNYTVQIGYEIIILLLFKKKSYVVELCHDFLFSLNISWKSICQYM